jgi:hypothetical protein
MASIHKEVSIQASPEVVWDALRDVAALHRRLAPGFVTNVEMEEGSRIVTFGNGMVVRELIVDIDDARRRLAWAVVGHPVKHHNGVAQVFDEGKGSCRFVWTADVLPDELAGSMAEMMEQGLSVIRKTLGRASAE